MHYNFSINTIKQLAKEPNRTYIEKCLIDYCLHIHKELGKLNEERNLLFQKFRSITNQGVSFFEDFEKRTKGVEGAE